ncbi:flagellar positioning protein PflI [Caulobacter segnis]|uniref:Polar flagellum positioning protein PflI n=2 Tax=Caulobacter segnis TaxID=88688 RepID=D5VIP7_CAUST|nr:DUF6468 domain-containing protein [Caulobacter segnis]ADG09863.1 polar flagellum positioning protein PflI [Caulobacter segnis ATCC 21756]AVQ01623.1 flagellar positioning protein PflI [Caulobacter segnis]
MSVIAFAMNGLLAVLLIVALGFGWRLERRLKALRDSHEGFAKAVKDLDQAAARAEQGLADLRAATDEAAETLAIRIERAQALAAQLDERISRPPPPRPEREAPPPAPVRGRVDEVSPAAERRLKAEDFERLLERESRLPAGARPTLSAPSAPSETPRSRARVDDDLFDGPGDPPRPGPQSRARR